MFVIVEKNVLRLYVAVDYSFFVKIAHSLQNLMDDLSCKVFGKEAKHSQLIVEFSAITKFSDNVKAFFIFIVLV